MRVQPPRNIEYTPTRRCFKPWGITTQVHGLAITGRHRPIDTLDVGDLIPAYNIPATGVNAALDVGAAVGADCTLLRGIALLVLTQYCLPLRLLLCQILHNRPKLLQR